MAGDLAALVADHDLARADPGGDAQHDQRDRDRVAVLPDRDQRLLIDARRCLLARVEVLDRQLPQRATLDPQRLPDRLGAADDPPLELGEAAVLEQIIELLQRRHLRYGHQATAAEATHFALDAALLVSALLAPAGEDRLVQVVRAQRDEAVLLDAAPAAQHLPDRRAQVVVAHDRERAAAEVERLHVCLQERLLARALERDHERGARVAGPHQEQVDGPAHAGDLHLRLAPVDLRLDAGLVHLRHEHLVDRLAQLAPPPAHVVAHRRLGDLRALLVHEALPDPLRRVPLLARRLPISDQPLVDQRPVRAQLRRRPAPKLGPYRPLIDEWLIADREAPRKQRHTAKRIWQRLVDEQGAEVAETTVRDYVRR